MLYKVSQKTNYFKAAWLEYSGPLSEFLRVLVKKQRISHKNHSIVGLDKWYHVRTLEDLIFIKITLPDLSMKQSLWLFLNFTKIIWVWTIDLNLFIRLYGWRLFAVLVCWYVVGDRVDRMGWPFYELTEWVGLFLGRPFFGLTEKVNLFFGLTQLTGWATGLTTNTSIFRNTSPRLSQNSKVILSWFIKRWAYKHQ